MLFLFIYSTHLVESVFKFMSVSINYRTSSSKKNASNLVLFVDEKFNISKLKKYILNTEYSYILELLKINRLNKKIISFEISSKRKIILVSLKNNISSSEAENLGAKFYQQFRDLTKGDYYLNSDTIPNQFNINTIGHFLHGIKLKSYKFEKYKTKKNNNNISLIVTGKNKPSLNDQIKFRAIEDGTFYSRDLVSEPGNILHPDEYAKRINSLKKFGL